MLVRLYICIVDNLYDAASTDTLQGIASGDVTTRIPGGDYNTLNTAARECSQQLQRELSSATG